MFSLWRRVSTRWIIFSATAAFGMGANADTPASAAPIIETLLVEGRAPSLRLSTLVAATREQVVPGRDLEFADLAQALPGLQIDKRTNYAQDTRLSVRGFGARAAFGVRGIKLYQDQIPLSMADGQGQLSSVLARQVASVSLVRGPLAGLYGGGAGAVLFVEKAPIATTQARLDLDVGEWGVRQRGLDAQLAGDALQMRVSTSASEFAGARAQSQASREHHGLDLHAQLSDHWRLDLTAEAHRDPLLQDPLGLTPAEWRADSAQVASGAQRFNTRKQVANDQVNLRLHYDHDAWQARLGLWQGERHVEQYLAIGATDLNRSGGVIDFTRDSRGLALSVHHQWDVLARPLDTAVGVELAHLAEDRQGYVNHLGERGDLRRDEDNHVETYEGYWLSRWQWHPTAEIYLGARVTDANYQSRDKFVVETSEGVINPDDSGRASFALKHWASGINWEPRAGLLAGVSHGASGEAPTLTEMAYSLDNQGFNRDLAPTRTRQWQVDLHWEPARYFALAPAWHNQWQVSASLFAIESEGELLVAASDGGRTVYRNAAATERRGLELTSRFRPHPQWQLAATTSFIDPHWQSAPARQLPGVARLQQQLELRYEPAALEGAYLSLAADHRARVYADDANLTAAPAFTRWDLTLGFDPRKSRRALGAYLSLSNLTDTDYVASVIVNQSAGRSFEPGLPRQVRVGVRLWL